MQPLIPSISQHLLACLLCSRCEDSHPAPLNTFWPLPFVLGATIHRPFTPGISQHLLACLLCSRCDHSPPAPLNTFWLAHFVLGAINHTRHLSTPSGNSPLFQVQPFTPGISQHLLATSLCSRSDHSPPFTPGISQHLLACLLCSRCDHSPPAPVNTFWLPHFVLGATTHPQCCLTPSGHSPLF